MWPLQTLYVTLYVCYTYALFAAMLYVVTCSHLINSFKGGCTAQMASYNTVRKHFQIQNWAPELKIKYFLTVFIE